MTITVSKKDYEKVQQELQGYRDDLKSYITDLSNITLRNPCKYSFSDLLKAANADSKDIVLFYNMTIEERNNEIKRLCRIAKWYYKDVRYGDKIFTSFSPEISELSK